MPQRIIAAIVRQSRRSDWLLIALTTALAAVASLAVGQSLLQAYAQEKLVAYADAIIAHGEQVSDDIVQVLNTALALTSPRCSDQDIDALRALVIQSRFVRDVSRMQDRQILCSAIWGKLDQPHPLSEPIGYPIGLPVWADQPTPGAPEITVNMTGRDDTAVTSAPTSLMALQLLRHDEASASLSSLSGTRVLGRFGAAGNADGSLLQPADKRSLLVVEQCSDRYNLCANAQRPRPWLLSDWPAAAAAAAVLGALAGALLGLLLVALRARQASLPMQLRRALRQDQPRGLSLRYQPLYRLGDGRLHGVEALARWTDEDGQIIPPETFVPVIEALGLSARFDRHVTAIAMSELEARLRDGDTRFYLSINTSAESIRDNSFHTYLQDQARKRRIEPERIVLEITERTTVDRPDLVAATRALREKGFNIHIDDFGTGYSSLSYLAELSIDAIKIDQSFTHAIGTGSPKENVVDAICHLARKLQVSIIAEGVEQQCQADRVLELESEALGQGWLFGRPLRANELPD